MQQGHPPMEQSSINASEQSELILQHSQQVGFSESQQIAEAQDEVIHNIAEAPSLLPQQHQHQGNISKSQRERELEQLEPKVHQSHQSPQVHPAPRLDLQMGVRYFFSPEEGEQNKVKRSKFMENVVLSEQQQLNKNLLSAQSYLKGQWYTFFDMIKTLKEKSIIRYDSTNLLLGFVSAMKEFDKASQFINYFKKFSQAQPKFPQVFPIANSANKPFMNQLFRWYILGFLKQNQKDDKEQKNSGLDIKINEIFYQFKEHEYQPPAQPTASCEKQSNKFQEVGKKLRELSLEENEESLKSFQQNHDKASYLSPQEAEQRFQQRSESEHLVKFNGIVAKIPDFFFKDTFGRQRLSAKRLLSFDVTSLYQAQLNQVRSTILDQLDNNKYLQKKLLQFLTMYKEFFQIKSTALLNQSDAISYVNQTYVPYLQNSNGYVHFNSQNKSFLMQTWQELRTNLNQPQFKKQIDYFKLKQHLKEKVNNITLFYNPQNRDSLFATTSKDGMFININHISGHQQSQLGPLKAYLMMCIYHQLAHAAIRFQFQPCYDLNHEIDYFFQLDKNTFGCSILKIIKEMMPEIKKALQKVDFFTTLQNNEAFKKKIQEKVIWFEQKIRKNPDCINYLKKNHAKIVAIIKQLATISYIKQNIVKKTSKNDWNQLTNHIREYQLNIPNEQVTLTNEQSIVMYLFCVQQYQKQLGISTSNNSIYPYARNEAIRPNGSYFFKKSNPIVAKIINSFKEDIDKVEMKNITGDEVHPIDYTKANPIEIIKKTLSQIWSKQKNTAISLFMKMMKTKFQQQMTFLSTLASLILDIDDQDSQDKMAVLQAAVFYSQMMRFIKHAQIYKIAASLPRLLFYQFGQGLDTGFIFEEFMFPSLSKTKKVYAKDFAFLKYLDQTNAKSVGEAPKQHSQASNFADVNRQGKDKKDDSYRSQCGVATQGYADIFGDKFYVLEEKDLPKKYSYEKYMNMCIEGAKALKQFRSK